VSITPEYSTVDQEINDSLTANVNGGTYPFNYTWYVGSQIVNYSQSFHYAFPDVATYTVKVVVADSLGQNTTDSVTIDSIHRPSVSVNGPNNTDLKVPTTFIGNATYGSAPYNYTWEINQVSVGYGLYLTYSFPSTGTFNVTLKATDSQGDVAYGYLNVVVHQLPAVSITPSKSAGDVGFTDTFTSTVSGGTTPDTYKWYVGSNEVGSQPNLTYTFSSQGTILVRLVIADGTGVSASAETNVTVNALPTVSISAKYLAIDTGIQDTFNATGSFGTSPYNYTWYVNSVIEGYGASLQYSFSSSGSQAVKVVLRDADGNTATSIASVQVYARPIPSILANRTTIDQGMGVQFLSGVSGGVGPYNYTWSIGGGVIGYGSIIDHKFLDAGTYYVNLTVSDSFGSTGHTSIAISVNGPMSVTISQSATKLDSGQSATFTPHVSGGTSPYHYIWEVNSITVSTQDNLTYIFTSPGTYEVYLQVTDAIGTITNATVSITVYADLSATISAEYPTVDQNITDNITLHPSNGTAPYTFYMAIDGHAVSNNSAYSQYFTSSGTYYISAYVNDSSGESVHQASTIVVRSDPSVIITTPTNRTDANVPIQFRGVLSGGTGPYSYSWLIGGHTYNGTTLSHSFASAGNYTIQLTVSDAFGREAIANLNETVFSDPHATLIAPSYVRASREIPLALNITGGIPSYKTQWYFPSGEQFSGKNITHAFINAGPDTFEAQVTDSTGYVDTQNFTVNVHLFVAIAANTTSGLAPLPVQFSSSVLGGSDYSYNWTFSPGHYSLLQNPVYQFQEGNYTANFHVTSSNGATGEENLTITSLPPPVTFSYSPHTNGTILSTFHFTATPNWDASSPYSMSWSFPNGQSLTGMNVSYQFPVYHEFNVVIATFTYGNGKTWTQDLSVRLYPAPIKASFSIPKIIPSGTLVNVTGVAHDPDSTSITYSWVFNGQAYSGQNQFFYFGNVGNYTISLTATDSLGATDTVTHVVQVENVTSNANIVIKVNAVSNGPYDLYHIRILSSAPIDIVEAFISSQSVQPVYVNDTDGYNYNLTLNQQNYDPGTYALKIVVFTTTGESNFVTETFFVSQTYGKGGAPFSLASFFGGSLNMILALVSITASISGVIFFWRDKKDKDTRYFNIGGTMVKGKVSPMSKYSFSKHTENNSQVPPSNNIPPSNPGEGNNGNNGNFGNNGGFF
jgi:PKD repeat protein